MRDAWLRSTHPALDAEDVPGDAHRFAGGESVEVANSLRNADA